jgi:hypothetical protein
MLVVSVVHRARVATAVTPTPLWPPHFIIQQFTSNDGHKAAMNYPRKSMKECIHVLFILLSGCASVMRQSSFPCCAMRILCTESLFHSPQPGSNQHHRRTHAATSNFARHPPPAACSRTTAAAPHIPSRSSDGLARAVTVKVLRIHELRVEARHILSPPVEVKMKAWLARGALHKRRALIGP